MKKQKMALTELKVKSFITAISHNPDTVDLLQKTPAQGVRGGFRSGEDGPRSCVNKQTICDCFETERCPTFTCNYTQELINSRCF
jgi:hypothetical protein